MCASCWDLLGKKLSPSTLECFRYSRIKPESCVIELEEHKRSESRNVFDSSMKMGVEGPAESKGFQIKQLSGCNSMKPPKLNLIDNSKTSVVGIEDLGIQKLSLEDEKTKSDARSNQGRGANKIPKPKHDLKEADLVSVDSKASKMVSSLMCCVTPPNSPAIMKSHFVNKEANLITIQAVSKSTANQPDFVSKYISFEKRYALLPPKSHDKREKKTLILDLDETLVHSRFKPVPNSDFFLSIDASERKSNVYVLKRPWVDIFMDLVGEMFEVVVFTASVSKYASPLLDLLDRKKVISHRLYRESCTFHDGCYAKDLSLLGRDLRSTVIIDNSPHSYIFQPENALPVGTFIDDLDDCELLELIPYLQSLADPTTDDVRVALKRFGVVPVVDSP